MWTVVFGVRFPVVLLYLRERSQYDIHDSGTLIFPDAIRRSHKHEVKLRVVLVLPQADKGGARLKTEDLGTFSELYTPRGEP